MKLFITATITGLVSIEVSVSTEVSVSIEALGSIEALESIDLTTLDSQDSVVLGDVSEVISADTNWIPVSTNLHFSFCFLRCWLTHV